MVMLRFFATSTAAMLLAACASQPATTSVVRPTESQVSFSSKQDRGQFTIECTPRSEGIANDPSWVDACNTLGRAAIDDAVGKRLIASVDGPAFGMASDFMKQAPRNLPITSRNPKP